MRLLTCSLLLLSLAACQPETPVGPHADAFFELADPDIVSIEALHGPAPEDGPSGPHPLTAAARESLIPAGTELARAIHSTEDWRGADAQLRTFLADAHENPAIQAWREIHVASAFLPGHLVNGDALTPEKQEAIAFYATLLIENRQLGGDKVTKALDRLEGYWPDAKLAEARQLVDDAALYAEGRR